MSDDPGRHGTAKARMRAARSMVDLFCEEYGFPMDEDMTIEEVHAKLAEIKAVMKDPEKAHMKEEALYISVLVAIAEQRHGEQPEALAAEALVARGFPFPRWCA